MKRRRDIDQRMSNDESFIEEIFLVVVKNVNRSSKREETSVNDDIEHSRSGSSWYRAYKLSVVSIRG